MVRLMATTAVGLVLALGVPYAAAQQQPGQAPDTTVQQRPGEAAGTALQQQQAAQQLDLVSAEDLVGRDIRAEGGEEAGTIRYVAIDVRTGSVDSVLIARGGELDIGEEEHAALPWQLVAPEGTTGEGAIEVRASLDQLKQAPKISQERLEELTQPRIVTQIIGHYALPPQGAATGGEQRAEMADERQLILIGREIIHALVEPAVTTAEQLKQAEVQAPDGQTLGSIESIFIDARRGRVAFLTIEGREGEQAQRFARVPLDALAWTPDQQTFVLRRQQMAEMPWMEQQQAEAPTDQGELQELYQQYGVQPYWQ